MEIGELAKLVKPYIRPLGYIMPPISEIQFLKDNFPKDSTPLREYCISAVSGNREIQTLCLILGA